MLGLNTPVHDACFFHVDDFALMKMEERLDAKCGFDARNSETFGGDECPLDAWLDLQKDELFNDVASDVVSLVHESDDKN